MRTAVLLLAVVVGLGVADDRGFCEGECAKKYKDDDVKAACVAGCPLRGSISDGSRGFVVCHEACATAHNQTDTEERRACDFACSLPVTNIVMMKVDYGAGEGGAPRVQVVRKEGGSLADVGINGFAMDLEHFMKGGAFPALGGAGDDKDKSSKEDDSAAAAAAVASSGVPMGMLQSMFRFKTDDDDFNQMQERLDKLVKSFFDRAHLASHGVEGGVAVGRPKGHDDFSFFVDPSSAIGNEDADGHQILFVAPMEGAERGAVDLADFERHHESSIRRRLPDIFQWSVCLILLIAVLCTSVIGLLMLRQMRANRYSALRDSQSAAGGVRVCAPSTTTTVEAGDLVKKVPIEMDEEESYPAPEGVPPPAYDQLSVHSKKSQQ